MIQNLAIPTKISFESQDFNTFYVNKDLKGNDQNTFLIQPYLFIRNIVPASRNFKFRSTINWLRKSLQQNRKNCRGGGVFIFLLEFPSKKQR